MKTSSTPIADVVDALADHIAERGFIKFRELIYFLDERGIDTAGDEALTGEHVSQAHVHHATTLLCPVSGEYVQIVEALFKTRPVMLEIGDIADFSGDEPWWVTWTGGPQAYVDAATEFVRDRGAVTFMQLADELNAKHGVPVLGGRTMVLGRHPVGDGVTMTRMSDPENVVLWNCGSTELLSLVELMLYREPRVVLERTTAEHYRLSGMVLLADYTDDGRPESPLPVIDFGDPIAAHGYAEPHWLPAVLAWAGQD